MCWRYPCKAHVKDALNTNSKCAGAILTTSISKLPWTRILCMLELTVQSTCQSWINPEFCVLRTCASKARVESASILCVQKPLLQRLAAGQHPQFHFPVPPPIMRRNVLCHLRTLKKRNIPCLCMTPTLAYTHILTQTDRHSDQQQINTWEFFPTVQPPQLSSHVYSRMHVRQSIIRLTPVSVWA